MTQAYPVAVKGVSQYSEAETALAALLEELQLRDLFQGKITLFKINLMKGAAPERALNTHPELVRALVRLARQQGGEAWVADSSGVLGFTREAFHRSGIEAVLREEKGRLINFDASRLVRRHSSLLGELWLPEELFQADLLVTVPKLKMHLQTIFSGALKNQIGILPGGEKPRIHIHAPGVAALARAIVELNRLVPFSLGIMDGILGFEGGGSRRGRPRPAGFLAASKDLTALDAVSAYLIGLNPEHIPTLKAAISLGLGEARLPNIPLRGAPLSDLRRNFKQPPFHLLRLSLANYPIYALRRRIFFPQLDSSRCQACGLCAQLCPVGNIAMTPKPRRGNRCIYCFGCRERCPNQALRLATYRWLKPLVLRQAQDMKLEDL